MLRSRRSLRYVYYIDDAFIRNFTRFVGAGGAGFVIALLTLIFDVPIHTALGTSLAAMAFTTLSGAYSHYREGNIQLKSGLIVGALACIASFAGAKVAPFIPEDSLHYLTAGMLFYLLFL